MGRGAEPTQKQLLTDHGFGQRIMVDPNGDHLAAVVENRLAEDDDGYIGGRVIALGLRMQVNRLGQRQPQRLLGVVADAVRPVGGADNLRSGPAQPRLVVGHDAVGSSQHDAIANQGAAAALVQELAALSELGQHRVALSRPNDEFELIRRRYAFDHLDVAWRLQRHHCGRVATT